VKRHKTIIMMIKFTSWFPLFIFPHCISLYLEVGPLSNFSFGHFSLQRSRISVLEFFPMVLPCFRNDDLLVWNALTSFSSSTGLTIAESDVLSICRSPMCLDASHRLNACCVKMPNMDKEIFFHLSLAIWPRNAIVAKNLAYNLEAVGIFGVTFTMYH